MKNRKTLYVIICIFFGLFLTIPSLAIGQEPIRLGTSWLLSGNGQFMGLTIRKEWKSH
jgi:hypothetical protein